MLGTLNGALEVRGLRLDSKDIVAEVEGINRILDGVPVLTEIMVRYSLRIPPGTRETVDRALERHQSKCPTAQSLRGAIDVRWTADVCEATGE